MYENLKITEQGYVIDEKDVHIKLISGDDIWGKINIAEYNVNRLSELFTKSDLYFIVVYNSHNSKPTEETEDNNQVLFINKDHILWVQPA